MLYDQIVSGLLGGLLTALTGYAIFRLSLPSIKKELFSALLDQKNLENVLQMAINNEKLQKFLYEAGGLLGSGAGAGIGLPGKGGGGKFKLQDMILQLAGSYLQNKMPSLPSANANEPSQQNSNSQNNRVGY